MGPAALAAAAATASLLRGAAAFTPFAGVDELRPQRLHSFCEPATEDGASGLRWCSHSVQRALEDGGDVQMAWGMRVNPDHILSLDTEAEHGVRLAECSPRELRLELPESHARHAAEGRFVVGSRFAHGCRHLEHRPLYHRIKEVKRHEWRSGPGDAPDGGGGVVRFAHVHLSTEELPSLAHIAPSVSFSFSYTPMEAKNVVPFPEMRTDFGANRPHLGGRRLFDLEKLGAGVRRNLQDGLQAAKAAAASEFGEGGAGFRHESGSTHSIDSDAPDLMNMAPKQVSNFGWNWDFAMNTTEEPEFDLTAPGAKGLLKVREPYIKAHAGIYLNFSSEFKGLTESPRVRWTAGLHGHGRMQARVLSMMNTTDSVRADDDAGTEVDLPFLEKFHDARWFDKIDIAAGSMPISFEPGIRFNSKMYHKGAYDGAIAVGGRTHGIIHPQMTFDSETGLDTRFEGELLDTDIWPPMWMIFTRRFELGLMATPTLLMRGDFAGVDKATLALEMHPYLNVTVRRDDEKDIKPLVVYPTRVMGLPVGNLGLQYKLAISANGQLVETRPRACWGQVVFHDGISGFDLGNVSRLDLQKQVVTLVLIQVDGATGDLPVETTLGSGVVVPGSPGQCAELESGGCRVVVSIQSDAGEDVAAVEVAAIWHDSPVAWLASRVRGAAVSVSALTVQEQDTALVDAEEALSVRIRQGGASYGVGLAPGGRGDRALEFGPGFVGGWEPCPQGASRLCDAPRVELYRGGGLVGAGDLPAAGGAPGANGTERVLLYAQGGDRVTSVGAVTLQVRFAAPTASSAVLSPALGHQAAVGSSQEVVWTASGAEPERDFAFRLSALRMNTEESPGQGAAAAAAAVGGRDLLPIPTAFWSVDGPCSRDAGAGGAASKYAPCTFAHAFRLHNETFSAGDVVVVQIEWEEGGATRTLLSPPLEVVAEGASPRRLGAMETFTANLRNLQDWGHHIFDNQEAWDQKVKANEESCNKRDLRFFLGAGMLGRAKLESFQIGNGGGSAPPFPGGLATPLQRVARLERGSDTRGVLPDELCADGLCSGVLPGCSQDGVKKHYPRLTFNFSRPLHYNKDNQATIEMAMQQVMAYAFSALPEAVNIAIKELNRSHRKSPGTTSTTTLTTTSPPSATSTSLATKEAAWWGLQESPGSPRPDAVAAPWGGAADAGEPGEEAVPELPGLGAAQEPQEGGGAGGWWPWGGRRLRDGRGREPERVHAHEVVVQFRDGLPYRVDRALVERMVRHGFFMDVEDGASATHGPLSVVNFDLEVPDEEVARVSTGQLAASQPSAQQKAAAVAAISTGVMGSALVAVWVARSLVLVRRRQHEWRGIPDGSPNRDAEE